MSCSHFAQSIASYARLLQSSLASLRSLTSTFWNCPTLQTEQAEFPVEDEDVPAGQAVQSDSASWCCLLAKVVEESERNFPSPQGVHSVPLF